MGVWNRCNVKRNALKLLITFPQLCEVAENIKLRFDLKSALQVHTKHQINKLPAILQNWC